MIEDVMDVIDSDSRPYWEAARRGELYIQYCSRCDRHQFYPRILCINCMSDVEWVRASGEGTVYSYSVVYRSFNPYFKDKVPYVVALIKLDEGPIMMTNIVDVSIEDVEIGMLVKAVFDEPFGDYRLVQFIPLSCQVKGA